MRAALLTFFAVIIAGCVTPQVEAPRETPLETGELGLAGPSVPIAEERWWEAFADPQLGKLMDEALSSSPTLAQALARVRAAQAEAQAANAASGPSYSITADETWQRFSEHFYIPPPFAGGHFWLGQATANLDWTLDFWGRQQALIAEAASGVLASRLDLEAAKLALTGAVAQAYLDLYRAWELLDIAERLQEENEQLLRLTQGRIKAGLDRALELRTAEARLAQARAGVLQARSARDLALHRLAALVGYGADRYAQIERPRLQLEASLTLPDQLPLDLLGRRPDVLAARARIEAAASAREAARAAFYPDINLKAFVGVQAIGLDELVESGSRTYGVGPALHLPIFDAQRLRAAYKGATAQLDAAIATYNATVLGAIRETADQLTLNASIGQQLSELRQAVEAASSAYELAQKLYGAGLTNQLRVLDAETQVLNARRDLVNASTNLALARISLRLMVGGTFDPGRV
ncbi:MAG TPA: efflux transporter outer membrane subunit [Steroidobacter sp.]